MYYEHKIRLPFNQWRNLELGGPFTRGPLDFAHSADPIATPLLLITGGPRTTRIFLSFYCRGLNLDPITFIHKLDLYFWKMYLHSKNELSRSMMSQVIVYVVGLNIKFYKSHQLHLKYIR